MYFLRTTTFYQGVTKIYSLKVQIFFSCFVTSVLLQSDSWLCADEIPPGVALMTFRSCPCLLNLTIVSCFWWSQRTSTKTHVARQRCSDELIEPPPPHVHLPNPKVVPQTPKIFSPCFVSSFNWKTVSNHTTHGKLQNLPNLEMNDGWKEKNTNNEVILFACTTQRKAIRN